LHPIFFNPFFEEPATHSAVACALVSKTLLAAKNTRRVFPFFFITPLHPFTLSLPPPEERRKLSLREKENLHQYKRMQRKKNFSIVNYMLSSLSSRNPCEAAQHEVSRSRQQKKK